MAILGIDLGGTSLKTALFSDKGEITHLSSSPLSGRGGKEVGNMVKERIKTILSQHSIQGIGVSVPGIYQAHTKTVWAPNIPGWENYPLLKDIKSCLPLFSKTPIIIENDRVCYVLGETWQGYSAGCKNAIFLSVGTGIGAGILVNGRILTGKDGIAGSVGWMAMNLPHKEHYTQFGCLEYHASGIGWAQKAKDLMRRDGIAIPEKVNAKLVFTSYRNQLPWAKEIVEDAITYWGMCAANLVSIFDPETIVFGGGLFGPSVQFIDRIFLEAKKWAQPISIQSTKFQSTKLGSEAGLIGIAFLLFKHLKKVDAL